MAYDGDDWDLLFYEGEDNPDAWVSDSPDIWSQT